MRCSRIWRSRPRTRCPCSWRTTWARSRTRSGRAASTCPFGGSRSARFARPWRSGLRGSPRRGGPAHLSRPRRGSDERGRGRCAAQGSGGAALVRGARARGGRPGPAPGHDPVALPARVLSAALGARGSRGPGGAGSGALRDGADRRIYLVLGADLMNEDAADALLKDLEEPPSYAVPVLVADDLGPLPDTIRSRCQHVSFRRLSERAVREALEERAPGLSATERT